jgi:hypothetical protein
MRDLQGGKVMMSIETGGTLMLTRNGRAVALQRITTCDRFNALVGCGVKESFAAAVVAKLIILRVRV